MTPIEAIEKYIDVLLLSPPLEGNEIQGLALKVLENLKSKSGDCDEFIDKILTICSECLNQGSKPSEFMLALLVCGITIGLKCNPFPTTE